MGITLNDTLSVRELTKEQIDEIQNEWKKILQTSTGRVVIMKPKIRILLLYIVYPMAIGTYFKKALEHREDVDLIVCGPYTGNWMPWLQGVVVPNKYAIPPDIPLPFGPDVGEVNYELVKHQLPDGWIPDIVLNIDAHLHWKNKPTDGMVVTVGTDPHVLNDWYDAPRKYSDKFFNMQLHYSKENDIYLPYAYSSYDHYPQISSVRADEVGNLMDENYKDTDAVLIGMPYENRVQWVNELRKRGVSVIFENGPIFDEARQLYNRGRIGLNWSSMEDLNARAFEIPAMKLIPIMNGVPDLHRFEFYKDTLVFSDLNGAIDQVMWAIDNPEISHRLAEDAYRDVQGQTYDSRIQQILKECGFAS